MTTPDGISTDDWDGVHSLAVEIVNADEDSAKKCRARLLKYLDGLEEKYGELPSILATRADYAKDSRVKERLLKRAYALACARSDAHNALYSAHSLAELYIEDLRDAPDGRKWLEHMKQLLSQVDDSSFAEEYARLLRAVQ